MEKNIIQEIVRINEIMGTSINEVTLSPISFFIRGIKNLGDDFLKYIERTPVTNRIIARSNNSVRNLTDDAIETLLNNITKESAQIISKLLYDNGLVFTKNAINKFRDERASEIIKNRERYNKVMREIIDGKDSFWGQFLPPNKVPNYLKDISDEYAELMKKDVDALLEKDYPSVWKYIKEKGWTGKTLKEIEAATIDVVTTLYKKLDPSLLKAFFQKITNSYRQLKLTADEIQSLIAKYAEKDIDAATKTQIEEILTSSMAKFAEQSVENFKFMRTWIDQNLINDVDLVKLKNKLKSSSDWKMAEMLSNTTSNQKDVIAFNEARKAAFGYTSQVFREAWNLLMLRGIIKDIPLEQIEKLKTYPWFKSTNELISPLKNWFLSGSKRGFPFKGNPNYNNIYQVAGTKTALFSYSAEVILNLIKFHIIWAVLETASEYLVYSSRGVFEGSDNKIANFFKNYIKDYKGSSFDASEIQSYTDIFGNFLRNLTDDFASSSGSVVQIVPGYWDNIAKLVFNAIHRGQTSGFIDSESVNSGVQVIRNEQERITDEAENLISQGEAELDSIRGGGPVQPQTGPRTDSDTTQNQQIDF